MSTRLGCFLKEKKSPAASAQLPIRLSSQISSHSTGFFSASGLTENYKPYSARMGDALCFVCGCVGGGESEGLLEQRQGLGLGLGPGARGWARARGWGWGWDRG